MRTSTAPQMGKCAWMRLVLMPTWAVRASGRHGQGRGALEKGERGVLVAGVE